MTGVNLAAVIEALIRTDPLTPEVMDEIVSGASSLMQRVKPISELAEDEDGASADEGFFD